MPERKDRFIMARVCTSPFKPGTVGSDVNWVGLFLKLLGVEGSGGIEFDGDFTPGGKIEQALRKYQNYSNIPETGEFDVATRQAIKEDLKLEFGIDLDGLDGDKFVGGLTASAI